MRRLNTLTWTCMLVAHSLGAVASPQTSSPQTRFSSSVELIVVDVTVLDKSGRPIPDLTAEDFSITVSGKKREVVTTQYLSSSHATISKPSSANTPQPAGSELAPGLPAPTEARTLMVLVDTENIRNGSGRNSLNDLADYFDTLPPTDEVGLVVLPFGTPHLDPTADRQALRMALGQTIGSHIVSGCDATIGEAMGDVAAYLQRTSALRCKRQDLDASARAYRRYTLDLFRSFASIATSLGERPGRRAMILVSEGLYSDVDTRLELRAFADALERAHVVLYSLHLDFPLLEAAERTMTSATRLADDRFGFDAMAEISVATGGEAVRAIAKASIGIGRIDMALSGSYLVAFRRLASDPEAKPLSLRVAVNRRGADVRARSHVTISPKR